MTQSGPTLSGQAGRVLVTGGTGFIGGHLCDALLRAGAQVEVWARSGAHTVPGVEWHAVDVRDAAAVRSALAARPPDQVFHLAGVRLMGGGADALATMMQTHALGALNIAAGLRDHARLLVVGSCEEYGRGPVPFQESQPAQPRTAYAVSRLAATLSSLQLATPFACAARLAVVYGPRQTGPMFIPSLFQAAMAGRAFEMSSGAQTRDFLYVEDAVNALLALARCDAARQQVVNVGSGAECSVRQVAQMAAGLLGPHAELRIGAIASRPGEADRYVCSIETVRALTGWAPQIGLADGLARTLAWWRQRAPDV